MKTDCSVLVVPEVLSLQTLRTWAVSEVSRLVARVQQVDESLIVNLKVAGLKREWKSEKEAFLKPCG